MNLYKVFVIDKYRGVLMSEHTCIGKDAAEAALGFQLSADERAVKEKDDLEIIWQNVGTFEKREVQRVLTEK